MKNRQIQLKGIQSLLKTTAKEIELQKRPSQVYPLSYIYSHIKTPSPFLKSSHYLMLIVEVGALTLQLNTERHSIHAGNVVFIAAGNIYSLENISDPLEGYFIQMESKVVAAIMNHASILRLSLMYPVMSVDHNSTHWCLSISKLLYDELSRVKPNRYIGQSLLRALLYKLLEWSHTEQKLSREQEIAIQFKWLLNKYVYTQSHIHFYASKLSISPNYLNRCVQSVFNKSTNKFIIETRVLAAKLLLTDSTKAISEIAYQLNFEDASYFARIFKKTTGLSPSQYRKLNMHEKS